MRALAVAAAGGPLAYGNDGTAHADDAMLTAAGLEDFSDVAFSLVRAV